MLVLIYRHLLEEGLKESADILGKYTCTLAPHSPTKFSYNLIWGGITEPTWILEQQLNILILVMILRSSLKNLPIKSLFFNFREHNLHLHFSLQNNSTSNLSSVQNWL